MATSCCNCVLYSLRPQQSVLKRYCRLVTGPSVAVAPSLSAVPPPPPPGAPPPPPEEPPVEVSQLAGSQFETTPRSEESLKMEGGLKLVDSSNPDASLQNPVPAASEFPVVESVVKSNGVDVEIPKEEKPAGEALVAHTAGAPLGNEEEMYADLGDIIDLDL